MTITQSMLGHAFNLLPERNTPGQKSGYPNLIKNGWKSANYLLNPVENHQLHMSK